MSGSKNNAAKALQAAKAKEALEAKKAADAAAAAAAKQTPTEEQLAADAKAKADKEAEDAKATAAAKAKADKEAEPVFKKGEFVNPFIQGVTYDIFEKALGGKSVEDYCKSKLEDNEIAWISQEMKHFKNNKKK